MKFRNTLLPLAFAFSALAGSVEAGDRITIQVGYGPGGSYDTMARLIADHLGRYLAGSPDIIVENVPGAGSLKLARLIETRGAADGSQIASVSNALALKPVFDPDTESFDPRNVRYIASASNESSYCVTPKNSGINSVEDFIASNAKAGATGKSSSTYTYVAAIKKAFDGKFDIVTGFGGGNEINLAMERGDVQVRCGISVTTLNQADTLDRYRILAELGTASRGSIQGEPFLLDLVKNPDDRAALSIVFAPTRMHHPYIVAGATPDAEVATLRAAFDALATDPEFLADAKKRGIVSTITDGATVEAYIAELLGSDPKILQRARELVE
ncbi:Bug family tripartite tricarboxylate transporter substrate binding protein [Thioclava pacifica]|uniref:C4-dicarboxylate ABC transporter substrate-binding protein n=1 Tax=Thioclava pacifica DSM 10166 TaxID=1353537 RepID=A0A074J099_9RHOB|nr:tripartite tricarboxylate transporter substrate-binding protein [Thioclava pacifica]KEO50801.1 hypothetical protein TP2_14330 [Thioclava pacifica DSM 10166]